VGQGGKEPVIRQGHLGVTEATVLVTVAISGKVFLSQPSVSASWVGTAAALMVLLNGLVALLVGWIILTTLDHQREEGLVAQFERLGGFAGTLMGAVLAATFIGVTALELRELAGQVLRAILPRTPITVVEGATVLAFSYAAYLGLETIARAAMVFTIPIGLGTFFLFLLSFSRFRFEHLLPLLGYGWRPLLLYSVVGGWYREAWLGALLMVYLRQRHQGLRVTLQGIGVSLVVLTVVTAALLAMFGYPNLLRLPFPALEGARAIYAGEFVSNLEAVFVFLFILAIFLTLSITFWASCLLVADVLHLAEYRPLIPLLATLTWLVAYLPPSLMDAIRWVDHDLRRLTSLILYPGVLLFWLLSLWQRRRQRREA
jgi:spore germination protein KB